MSSVTYRDLPFRPATRAGFIHGEPIAPVTKRVVSGLVDYGWIPVAVWAINFTPLNCGTPERFGDPACIAPGTFGTPEPVLAYGVLAILVAINSLILPCVTSQSLGRYVTKTCIVRAKQRRLEKPGYLRIAVKQAFSLLLILLTASFVALPGNTAPFVLGAVIAAAAVACVALDPLRRTPSDLVAQTVVLDRVLKFLPSGRQDRVRSTR